MASSLKNFSSILGSSVYSCVCIHLQGGLYNYKKSDNLGMLLPITGFKYLWFCMCDLFWFGFFSPWMSEFLSKSLGTKSISAFLYSPGEYHLPIQYPL